MTSDHIWLELTFESHDPAVLEGLDYWLRLGLLSEDQVRRICQARLSCSVPIVPEIPELGPSPAASQPDEDFAPYLTSVSRRPAPDRSLAPEMPTPVRSSHQDVLTRLLQSLIAEFSVRWLLFISMFMVVVSSGVLAAIQWQNFTREGQYSILLGYTLAFGIASLFTSRRSDLHLTAQMLRATTLLLIPVNFWMMDELNVFRSGVGWVVAAIAALLLSGMLFFLQSLTPTNAPPGNSRLTVITSIGLSGLHWGWGWAGIPLLFTYLGTIATAVTLFYQDQTWTHRVVETSDHPDASGNAAPAFRSFFTPGMIAVIGGALLLLFRAIVVRRIAPQDMGLALGICGWLLCWLSRREPARAFWVFLGTGLLVASRLLSVNAPTPWQAIAISGLALWILGERWQRHWQLLDLVGLFLVGLQSLWPLRRLIPEPVRQQLVDLCIQVAGAAGMPSALWGVTLFPYLGLWLWVVQRLRHQQRAQLARAAELMSLGLGIGLTVASLLNPVLRSLNLLLSAATLIWITRQRPQTGRFLVYLTHGTGLAAIAAIIQAQFPDLALSQWAAILLGAMATEWMFCGLNRGNSLWHQSAWHWGLAMSVTSYTLLLADFDTDWNWLGLLIPLMLTGLATRTEFAPARLAAWLSILALIAVQPLTFSQVMPRLLGLGLATILMLVNTYQLQRAIAAVITLGFGLTFTLALGWHIWDILSTAILAWLLRSLAIATLVLWLLRDFLRRRTSPLAALYKPAADGWAIGLTAANLVLITGTTSVLAAGVTNAGTELILQQLRQPWLQASVLSTLAMIYRTWQQPHELGFFGIFWGLELVLVHVIDQAGGSTAHLAIANLALGLSTQLLADGWVRQSQQPYRISWHVIPLLSAGLGFILQHNTFTASTGLYTLGAALIGIGVGRRMPSLQPLTYFALLGIAVGAYELLIYQLLQMRGGSPGDGLVVLAALGTLLAGSYRLLSRWLLPYLRISESGLRAVAHLHWGFSSALLSLALVLRLSSTGETSWLVIAAVLTSYALIQGRTHEFWTYTGILEAGITGSYWLHLRLPDAVLGQWGGAIAAVVAFGIHQAPWSSWGWSARPWRRSAMILPGLVVLMTVGSISIQSLLIVAAFYAWLAQVRRGIRISYVSILLADWAIWRLFQIYEWTGFMAFSLLAGGSLLYVAQIDPALQPASERDKRHLLRMLATGLIGLAALYESDQQFLWGLLAAGSFMGLMFAGLFLRVRAFLYVGTIAFILKVLRQLWLFITDYSLVLWIIGFAVGSVLFVVAVTFESRRHQVITLLQSWVEELQAWE